MTRTRTIAPWLVSLVVAALVAAAGPPRADARVSAVGLIDYTKRNFKIGDWVRYRVDLSHSSGMEDVKQQEVRIVGEETFRGERCFWVETWYGNDEPSASYDLALVSYDVFKDVAPDLHYRNYIRLILLGLDNEGLPEMNELQRSNPNAPLPDLRPYRGTVDTLGTEAIETPRGTLDTQLVRLTRRNAVTRPLADSTINRISVTLRKSWYSRKIPVTSLVREEESSETRVQSYALGTPSTSAPEMVQESLVRSAVVIDWGTGAKSDLLAPWRANKGLLRVKSGFDGLEGEADLPR